MGKLGVKLSKAFSSLGSKTNKLTSKIGDKTNNIIKEVKGVAGVLKNRPPFAELHEIHNVCKFQSSSLPPMLLGTM